MTRVLLATVGLAALVAGSTAAQQVGDGVEVGLATSERYGEYLVDGDGFALYAFLRSGQAVDETVTMAEGVRSAAANCTGECLEAWPPTDAPGGVEAAVSLDDSLLYAVSVEGVVQAVYNGWPLYYFARDELPGQTAGQGIEAFGGEWYLVDPDEGLVMSETATAAAQPEEDRESIRRLDELRLLLEEQGVAQESAEDVADTFDAWLQSLEEAEDPELEVIAASVEPVVAAFEQDRFDESVTVQRLNELALAMRVAASERLPDEESLLVEVASLLDQTAQLIQGGEYEPRMEVNVP